MTTLSSEQVETDAAAYAASRAARRRAAIRLRAERRVRLGPMVCVEFENAETLAYQVQEMVYAERVSAPAEVDREVATYRRLLPDSHRLCATVFIELSDRARVREELARLDGLQRALAIELPGGPVAGEEILGPDDQPVGPMTSVHAVRFVFSDAARDSFRDPHAGAELVVGHPAYQARAGLTGATRASLLADLAGG